MSNSAVDRRVLWNQLPECVKDYGHRAAVGGDCRYQRLRAHLRPKGTLIWSTTTPVPPSYHNRNNSDVLRINAQMAALFGPAGKHPEVVLSDMCVPSHRLAPCPRPPMACPGALALPA